MATPNALAIWSFLAGKGLSPAAISAFIGNFMVESGLSTTSFNQGENAHGLANWEGGRWTALQSFAQQMGGSPDDMAVQLNFLWHELTTSYSGVLNTIRGMSDPQQIAAYLDEHYEVSSGSARQERMSNALTVFNTFQHGGVSALDNIPNFNETVDTNSGGGSGGGMTSGGGGSLTPSDYQAALGSLSGLLTTIPELKNILQEAVSGGWAISKFQQAIEQTKWYRTHNSATRELLALKVSDPAEYGTRIKNASSTISEMAGQLGVKLSAGQIGTLAEQYLMSGWSQADLQHHIAGFYNRGGTPQGQAAQIFQQLQQTYASYGVPINQATLQYRTQQILAGNTTIDTYKQDAMQTAESLFPSISQQIAAGRTVQDIASPFIQTMANTLEIDPNNINLSDPTIQKALQGSVTTDPSGKQSTATMTLYDFQKQLRSDPRWGSTQNAKDTISSALVHIGRDFGLGF